MTKNVRLEAALGLIVVILLCLGYAGFRVARTAEKSRLFVSERSAALDARIRDLESLIAASGRNRAEPRAWSRVSQPVSMGVRKANAPASNPKVTVLQSAAYRANIRNSFWRIYQDLGLTSAQIAQFEELMTARSEIMGDIHAAAAAEGMDDSEPDIAALRQQEDDKFRAEQIALLGDAGYQQLQQFRRVTPVWSFIDGLNTISPADPLTGRQAQQLAAVLKSASSSYQSGGSAFLDSIDWNAALAEARGILSGSQFDGLKGLGNEYELQELRKQFFQRAHGN